MFGGAGEAQSDVYFDGDEVFSFIETNTGNHKSKKRKVYFSYLRLGKPSFKKSAVFLNIVQKAFDPPPFYLNICPILQGVFFKTRF